MTNCSNMGEKSAKSRKNRQNRGKSGKNGHNWNLFSTNQSQRELKFLFKLCSIFFRSGSIKTRHESSAYKSKSQSTAFAMSFTYKRKINGPRIEPWGTPHERFPGKDNSFSIFTKNVLFSKYDLYQEMVDSPNPKHAILFKNISWSIVSNAFCKSIRIIPVNIPLSIPDKILLFNNERHVSVEYF